MKKLFLTLLLFGLMPILGMEREDMPHESDVDGIGQFFAHGLRRFDADTVIETLARVNEISKRAEEAELLKEYLKIETSDGYEYTFTQRDLRHLQSDLLNKFWETDDVFDFTRPLTHCDAQTLNKILKLVEARDRNEILASLSESEIEVLIMALDELQMTLCDEVCKWVANNYDFTRFDGKNLFPELIKDKEERCCYPLQQALIKKLRSTEFALSQMCKSPITLNHEYLNWVAIATDSSFIVTGSKDGTARIWRLNEEHELVGEPITLAAHANWVTSIAIASDNSFVVTGSRDRTAKIWRLNKDHEQVGESLTLEGHTDWVRSIAIASDNSFVVTGSYDRTAKIWRLNEEHELVGEPITFGGHADGITSVAIAKDNSFIATGSKDRTAKIWRLNEEHERVGDPITLAGHTDSIYSVAIAKDNSFIITRSYDGTAKIWRLNEEHELVDDIPITLEGHTDLIRSVAIAKDNSFVVTGSYDRTAKIWRLNKDHELVEDTPITLEGHTNAIFSVSISSDNSFVVTGSYDRTAKIWRLNEEHELVGEPITFGGHADGIISVAIAKDNSFIATGSDDGIKIWRILEIDDFELNLPQVLLLLKLVLSESKIDFEKEEPEIRVLYESLPSKWKAAYLEYRESWLVKFCKRIKKFFWRS